MSKSGMLRLAAVGAGVILVADATREACWLHREGNRLALPDIACLLAIAVCGALIFRSANNVLREYDFNKSFQL
jgi:hypothetical protein